MMDSFPTRIKIHNQLLYISVKMSALDSADYVLYNVKFALYLKSLKEFI